MRGNSSLKKRLKRVSAGLLAAAMAVQSFFCMDYGTIPAMASETEGHGTVFPYYDTSNLLKPGASFPFYGKEHNRVGLWPYGITNVEGGMSAPAYCLEPNKSMRSGTGGTIVTYDLDEDGDNLPLGITREEAEILWYALSSSGNFEGYQTGVGRVGQGSYILGQCATWAIMSGNWNGLDDFRNQMEVLMANLKSPALAQQTRSAMEQFFNQTNGAVEEISVPSFASKYKSTAPVHQMQENDDGTYSITLKYDEGFDWRQSTLVYDLPEGWTFTKESDGVTFTCTTGDPDIGLVRGHFEEGSGGATYWVKPNTFKIWFPDGWDETSAIEGMQAMITMAGEQQTWEVWLAFGEGEHTEQQGTYEIPYTQYLHEETFKRDYKIELEKLCDETGKPLEGSTFEILEQFDFSQLDGTNLERQQFEENKPEAEGKFHNLSVCQSEITTDSNGHLEHSDHKTYHYQKTYCGGHPDPVITYVEVADDATEEEIAQAEEENARLEEAAWAAWQECVDWCEENCDFHSIDEGIAEDDLQADRDAAWNFFIQLKRSYTVRETQARNGYILHDLHNDDIQVEIVEFTSSQAGGEGVVTGRYQGNKTEAGRLALEADDGRAEITEAAFSVWDEMMEGLSGAEGTNAYGNDTETEAQGRVRSGESFPLAGQRLLQLKSLSNLLPRERIVDSEAAETDEPADVLAGHSGDSMQEFEDVPAREARVRTTEATPSNARPMRATPSDASYPISFRIRLSDNPDDGETSEGWEWDGVQEESEVPPVNQSEYPADRTGYRFTVKDHRTEGELHINKRDLELYEEDESGSYGKSQADATLEGAVYGLYAAEDIIHPDGKTGKVFSAGDLVAVASTDKNGDASFLVITEVSEASRNVPNLYSSNEQRNGNGWIGRPLLLGSYYVEEIARSEGYELSQTGKNLTESNRKGRAFVLAESGSVYTNGFYHGINEWDGTSYDFDVDYYGTSGFDIYLSGLPQNAKLYEVTESESTSQEQAVVGTKQVEKRDENGNIIYQTAQGGEYKLDETGNKKVKMDGEGNPVLSDTPQTVTQTAVNRLNAYISSINRGEPTDPALETSEEINQEYIINEVSTALRDSGYKGGLTDAPWTRLKLAGTTNGGMITEILKYCASDSFWDAYELEEVVQKDGVWYAKIRYAYKALGGSGVIYDRAGGKLAVRKTYDGGYYYAVYEAGEYERDGMRFTIENRVLDPDALADGEIRVKPVYNPVYETYAPGEFLLDSQGQKIPVMETVPEYGSQEITTYEESLKPLEATYDAAKGRLTVHISTDGEEFGDEGNHTRRFRVAVEGEITRFAEAAVSVTTEKQALDEGSYVKQAVLLYPGQYDIYEDDGTRITPIIVLERVIKQAIKVTKDIALDSYEYNNYEIHRDPFTVLFGGYNGKQEAKTLPGFFFKLYLRSDLESTGKLKRNPDGTYDYGGFFADYPEYAQSLALDWDVDKYDEDGDPKTVHASRGGGKDDYWGQSRMLPYGVYVLVEQQPTQIPQKHYAIDAPQEVEIPFIPQVDADGTVHDNIPSSEYLYDSQMTPEKLTERYRIRFNEETHVIYAHNNDGDFEVFKYGLEPDSAKDCGNETVAGYYHYGSISEDAGTADGVYYETYYDRNGNISDYGLTLDGVATLTGVSTAVDRQFAKALIPWSVLDPRYGEVINDEGDIGNRDSGLEDDGSFNFVAFSNKDFENEFYSTRLRIEKLDAETGENILHDGALFKIYAAKRDISGSGASGVTGTGDVLFGADGVPLYDENEQVFMQDASGAEVGIFKAYSTVRDGEVMGPDGKLTTEKQTVGYIELYQPLGAGAYVLVEIEAPEGYVRSKPIAFIVYSDKVEYYEDGDPQKKKEAVRYQYVRPVGADGKTVTEDMHQITVKDAPTRIEIHKVEDGAQTITYRVDGDEAQLKARGDVELQYLPNGEFAGFGFVTRNVPDWSKEEISGTEAELLAMGNVRLIYDENGRFTGRGFRYRNYVGNATLTLYEGLEVKKTGEHEYEGVTVMRNLFDSVVGIRAEKTGTDADIRKTGKDSAGRDLWDITEEAEPAADLWYYDLEYDPTELDEETGILYGLDDWGNRICMLDSETGMAYVTDEKGAIIVWPLDDNGEKIISQSVEVYTDEEGRKTINSDLMAETDENGLPVYYKDGGVTWIENEWVTSDRTEGYPIARVAQGAYILEETAAPLAYGYVQSMAVGLIVKDMADVQSFFMEDDYTKIEISKLDMTTREEIAGAALTLYEAYREYDDSDRGWHLEILKDSAGEPVVAETWISEGVKPHWIDHIMPGDYILEETRVPTAGGYVTSASVEVVIEETGEVQAAVMEDDHTAVEFLKVDARTGKPMDNDHKATLALYAAVLNDAGEHQYDSDGNILYDTSRKIYEWQTDDGSDVKATAHQVEITGGHSYTAYDYDVKKVPQTQQAVCYITETGAMRFEYLPVGKYVLVEEKAPVGYLVAAPLYVSVLDIGSRDGVQQFSMIDEPILVYLTKVNAAGGKEIAGATLAVYRAKEDGSLAKSQMKDKDGNLLYVTDLDGNLLRDSDGSLIPAVEYDQSYLVDRWISGSDGAYMEEDAKAGRIPAGYEAGDLRLHELKDAKAGSYYFVEEETPFGYTRAAELPFEIVDTETVQKLELVDELILGQLQIRKSDAKIPDKPLAGARFRFTNLDTNSATILITGEDGQAFSREVPIGSIAADGSVSLYHFSVQEISAPDGYLLDDTIHEFQFNVNTDRYHVLTYLHEVKDSPSKVIVSKKALTTKEELPGASLEIRPVTSVEGGNGEIIRKEGDVIEAWVSTDTPHEIEGLMPGDYVLIETRAPEGFLEAEKVYFTVKENMTIEDIPLVEMFDDDTKTEFKKIDRETKEPVAGVKLQLIREDTGEVVEEWVTDESGTIQFTGLKAGNYLIKEMDAPDGYLLLKEPFRVTVTKDYKLQTFVLENQKIEVVVEKRDAETREFVSGAVLQLVDEAGSVVAEWTTSGQPEVLKGMKPGTYTLREKTVPEGYLLMKEPLSIVVTGTEGRQVFTITNQKIEVDIQKTDKDSGALLPGAKLRLTRDSDQKIVREWVSGSVPEVFKGLVPGTYTLEELSAPEGYATGRKQSITVAADSAKQVFSLENEKITVELAKVNGLNGEIVSGARLQLIRNAGTEREQVVAEWVSGNEPYVMKGIPAGTYVIRETEVPEGFVPMDDMTIEILPDQALQQYSVKNMPIRVELEKTNGSTGKLLGGATLQLIRNRDGAVIREWISKENEAEAFEGLEAGKYTVREVKAPAGYRIMDAQVIEIKAAEGVQVFDIKNYRIQHSGSGDNPGPKKEYMELYKIDGRSGKRLAGARITVYAPDGSIYFDGVTDTAGVVRFARPATGIYTFRETEAPPGYYLNGNIYQFIITAGGNAEGDTTIPDYEKVTVTISKEDVTTAEELPGAEIEITDEDGNVVYKGTSDADGKIYFDAPEPGVYQFYEKAAPDGYELNETVFSFTVFDDGTIVGDCTIKDRKHYGRITAEYETERNGDGDLTIKELLHVPETGDNNRIGLVLLAWLVSAAGMLVIGYRMWKEHREDRKPPKGPKGRSRKKRPAALRTGAFFLTILLAAGSTLGLPPCDVYAAEGEPAAEQEVLENIYEEHFYTTDNPDSDEAQQLFEKEIERDGRKYRLSEIRTEVVEEEPDPSVSTAETLEIATDPFLKTEADKHKPAATVKKDGKTYTLSQLRLKDTLIAAHEEAVQEDVTYESMEVKDRIPSEISVTVTDEGTGQSMKVSAKAADIELGEAAWTDGFSFTATFHEYGLDGYWLGEQVFFLENDIPDFEGYEDALLSLIDADNAHYRVEDAQWAGEAYKDEEGILCRDAAVTGKKLVQDCTVRYTGTAVFPEEAGARYIALYESEQAQSGQTGQVSAGKYRMKAIGVYEPRKVNGALLAAAAIGLTGAGAGGTVYAVKRRRRQIQDQDAADVGTNV